MDNSRTVQNAYKILRAGIFGHAVGDALGVPVEFSSRTHLIQHPVTDLMEPVARELPKGVWSDDTSMVLCTMTSLTERGNIVPEDIMLRFSQWATKGFFTPQGRAFGMGRTTCKAIADYLHGRHYGCKTERDCGNGSLMRILPIPLYQHITGTGSTVEQRICSVHTVSALTHAHPRAMMACGIYSFVMEALLEQNGSSAILRGLEQADAYYQGCPEHDAFSRLFSPDFARMDPEDIHSSGYVVDTLEAALWCLLNTEDYSGCVLQAVNLGGDTDTVAAVACGLAGIRYGFDAIPTSWVSALLRHDRLEQMCMEAAQRWSSACPTATD